MTEEGLPKICTSIKAAILGGKNVKINLFRILEMAKVLQHSENLFKKRSESYGILTCPILICPS